MCLLYLTSLSHHSSQGSADIDAESARRNRERQSRQAVANAEAAVTKEVVTAVHDEQHSAAATSSTPGGQGGCQGQEVVEEPSSDSVSTAAVSKVTTGCKKSKKAR